MPTTESTIIGPPVNRYHLFAAVCRLHPLGLSARQVRIIRRLDAAHASGDRGQLEALEERERITAAGRADRHLIRTADRARRRPLTRLRKLRLRGVELIKRLLDRVVRDDASNVLGRLHELDAAGSRARAAGSQGMRPLTGRWRVVLPLLFPLEVLFSAVLYARVADLELIELAIWSLPAAIAWGIMALVAAVTALAVHLAGRRLADPRPVDRLGYPRPRLIHALAPGLVLTVVSAFYGTGAYLRMSGLVAGRGARLGELATILPTAYAVLLGLAPLLVAWSIARAHSPEQDELRRAKRADRKGRRYERRRLRQIDRVVAANDRVEADLRGRHQKALQRSQQIFASVEVAIEVNCAYRRNGRSTTTPSTAIAMATRIDPWQDVLDELAPSAQGRGWIRQLPALKANLIRRRARR